jgi:hypothetical protein
LFACHAQPVEQVGGAIEREQNTAEKLQVLGQARLQFEGRRRDAEVLSFEKPLVRKSPAHETRLVAR